MQLKRQRRPIRRRRIKPGVYAALMSTRYGIQSWAIQRGRKPPQKARFRSLKAVRRAVGITS